MTSVLKAQIPTTKSRLDGLITSRESILDEILRLLAKKPYTPSQLADNFNLSREWFSKNYLYLLRDSNKIEKIDGSNYFQLVKQKNSITTIRKALESESEIFQTGLFQAWLKRNHSKKEHVKQTRFARIVLGEVNPKFVIHPDNITKENWKEIVTNMVDCILEVATYEIVNGEPNWSNRQAIRHAIKYGLGIEISEDEGIELRISGRKQDPATSDLHITPEQISEAKKILKQKYKIVDFVKFGVKTWTFVRPSTIYLIELENMEFYDEKVEYVEVEEKKITDANVVSYAKIRGDKINYFERRVCHLEVLENKTSTDYHKYILDPEFVEPLEKFYNIRKSQRKKYLFWEDNNTKFEFLTYDAIVHNAVDKDNTLYKRIFKAIGFQKSDFGKSFRANYGFRHFGIQMWLIATDYNYDLVSEMSHEDTATLKKWYGKRTQKDFQRKIKGIMVI